MITNLNDLHNLFFNELKLPFREFESMDLISKSNTTLFQYVTRFGASIPTHNQQDHFDIIQNETISALTNVITENSGNWTIAVHQDTNCLYTNEHWLYTESDLSDFRKLNVDLEECLISFSLQELYFAFCDQDHDIAPELNLSPIWTNKRYSTNEKTHSFLYDSKHKALKFVHTENNFDKIAFIK